MKFLIFATLSISAYAVTHLRDVGPYKECNPKLNKAHLDFFDVYPCGKAHNDQHRCQLVHNETVKIDIRFTSLVNTTKVKTIVHGIGIFGSFLESLIKIAINDNEEGLRFQDIKEDACVHHDVDHCNIFSGERLNYTNSIFIRPLYPKKTLTIRFELRDDKDQDLVCVEFPAEIFNVLPK